MFNGLHQSSNMETVETVYQGSSIRLTDRDYRGLTHVALGFNAASWADKDVYAASVLQTLLGGGNAYSSGGPGKGMHSRLYQDVLSKHNWIESATCFNSIYSDAGLFGFYASAPPEAAGAVVDVLLQETRKMTTVSEEELVRSKNMLLSNVLSYFDNPAARTEEMARSVSTSGRFHTNDLIEGIRSVTKEDLERVGTKIMASPISSATYGKATAIPREIKL
jgi:processing peptidase subunit alpha